MGGPRLGPALGSGSTAASGRRRSPTVALGICHDPRGPSYGNRAVVAAPIRVGSEIRRLPPATTRLLRSVRIADRCRSCSTRQGEEGRTRCARTVNASRLASSDISRAGRRLCGVRSTSAVGLPIGEVRRGLLQEPATADARRGIPTSRMPAPSCHESDSVAAQRWRVRGVFEG